MSLSQDRSVLNLHWKDGDPDLGLASEGVFCKDMDEIIRRIDDVKDTVKKIVLTNQHSLTEIPLIINECRHLEKLHVSFTRITEIPAFLFSIPNLNSLSICCWNLTKFPLEIIKAKKLEKLHMRVNKGWSFPNEVTTLKELKILTIEIDSEITLPEELGNLKKLELFAMSLYNGEVNIPSLPASFKNHPSLKKFITNNHVRKSHKSFDLDSAAKILSTCPSFESLLLSELDIGKGHQSISYIKELKELDLRHLISDGSPFDALPSLHKLEKLYIWGSDFKITELPDIFNNFPELRVFSFAGNMVRDLPPTIFNLINLTNLEIGSTGISSISEKIGNLKTLEKIHVYDNMLETLPKSILSLPHLAVLNIEENNFKPNIIAAIKNSIASKSKASGKKIEFVSDGQGHRQMVKKLRTINASSMDTAAYYKHCLNAVNENPYALKYADNDKFRGSKYYSELCAAAVRKNCLTLELIDTGSLVRSHYFYICMEAARSSDIGSAFKYINDTLLTEREYLHICIEAALHNKSTDFLNNINNKSPPLNREDYERICWVAVLHYPPVISKMAEPTAELRNLAASLRHKHN
ncbi:MAG: hypothetical protein FWC03_06220 [Treponema sp.]|nr:hypothetical protein [Treponema sp.]